MHRIVPGESSSHMTSTALVASLQINRSRSVSDRYPAFAAHATSTSSQRKLQNVVGSSRQFSRSISAQDAEDGAHSRTAAAQVVEMNHSIGHRAVGDGFGKGLAMTSTGGVEQAHSSGSRTAAQVRDVETVAVGNGDLLVRGTVGAESVFASPSTSDRSPLQVISNNPRRPRLHPARSMGQLRSPPKGSYLDLPMDRTQSEEQKQQSNTGKPLQNSPLRERRCKQPLSIKAPPPPSSSSTTTAPLRRPRARSVTSSNFIYSPPPCPPPTTPLPDLPPNSAALVGGSSSTKQSSESATPNGHPDNSRAARGWLQDETIATPPSAATALPPLILSASSECSSSSSPSPASSSSKYSPIGHHLQSQGMQRGASVPSHTAAAAAPAVATTSWTSRPGTKESSDIQTPWTKHQDYIFDRLGLSFAQQLDSTTTTVVQHDAATNALLHSRISLDVHTKEDVYDDDLHVYGLAM